MRRTRTNLHSPILDSFFYTNLAPPGESDGPVQVEIGTQAEMAFSDKMFVDRGEDNDGILQTSNSPQADHGPFPSSKQDVQVFELVVQPAANQMLTCGAAFVQ